MDSGLDYINLMKAKQVKTTLDEFYAQFWWAAVSIHTAVLQLKE